MQSGGGEDTSKKDVGKGPSEQTKSLAKAQRSARDKVIIFILTKILFLLIVEFIYYRRWTTGPAILSSSSI